MFLDYRFLLLQYPDLFKLFSPFVSTIMSHCLIKSSSMICLHSAGIFQSMHYIDLTIQHLCWAAAAMPKIVWPIYSKR